MIFMSTKNKYTFERRKEDGKGICGYGFCGGFMRTDH